MLGEIGHKLGDKYEEWVKHHNHELKEEQEYRSEEDHGSNPNNHKSDRILKRYGTDI